MNEGSSIRDKLAAGLFWSYAERISAQLVSFVVSIILARLLDPEHYGIVAIVMVFISIANVFVSDSFGSALIQKKNADEIDFSTVFYINLMISVLLYFVVFFASPYIAKYYNDNQISPVLRVLSLKLILSAWNSVQNAYVSKNMQFKRFFFATLTGTIVSGIVGIFCAFTGFGVWALVVQYLTNSTIDTLFLHYTCGWHPQKLFARERIKELVSFGGRILIAELIQKIYDNLRTLFIGKAFTTKDLSFYDRGRTFPSLIVDNINTSISKTLFPAMSMVQDNREKLLYMTRKSISVSAYLLSPLLIGLAVCGESVVSLLLTEKWLGCVPFLRIISITYLFMPMHKANLQAIKALGRSDIILRLEYFKKGFGIIALFLAVLIFKTPIAVAWSLLISTLFNSVVNAYPNIKLLNYTIREQFSDLLPNFGAAIIMACFVWGAHIIPSPPIMTLVIQICIGAIVYVIISQIFHMESYYYVKSFVISLFNKLAKKNMH